jgi:hypothetical protein
LAFTLADRVNKMPLELVRPHFISSPRPRTVPGATCSVGRRIGPVADDLWGGPGRGGSRTLAESRPRLSASTLAQGVDGRASTGKDCTGIQGRACVIPPQLFRRAVHTLLPRRDPCSGQRGLARRLQRRRKGIYPKNLLVAIGARAPVHFLQSETVKMS